MSTEESSQRPDTPIDNPLLEKLTPSQFQATVKFYEADQRLSQDDRTDVANDLMTRVRTSTIAGLGASTLMMFVPTLYAKVMNVRPPLVPGPRNNLRRPMLYRPVISFLLSLATMLAVNQQVGKSQFAKKIQELEDSGVNERQLEVWKAMDYHQAGVFFLYFKKTSVDPSYILKDPRSVTSKTLHEVAYHPPRSEQGKLLPAEPQSQWDKIRRENGFAPPEPKSSEEADNLFYNDTNDNEFVPDIESTGDQDEIKKPASVWETLRQSKK